MTTRTAPESILEAIKNQDTYLSAIKDASEVSTATTKSTAITRPANTTAYSAGDV